MKLARHFLPQAPRAAYFFWPRGAAIRRQPCGLHAPAAGCKFWRRRRFSRGE